MALRGDGEMHFPTRRAPRGTTLAAALPADEAGLTLKRPCFTLAGAAHARGGKDNLVLTESCRSVISAVAGNRRQDLS